MAPAIVTTVLVVVCVISQSVVADYSQCGLIPKLPGKSCNDIYQLNPSSRGVSGYYIVAVDTTPSFVYCDMKLKCGGEKGWMRVANISVTNGDRCPNGWKKITSPVVACRAPSDKAGCYSAHFSTHNIPYSRICGMIVGYQKGSPDGFASFVHKTSINDPYVDGVSITYGTPRKHIWSYGAGFSENNS